MNDPAEHEPLLAALFSEDESARTDSWEAAIASFRGIRQRRRARRRGAVAVAVAVAAALLLLLTNDRTPANRGMTETAAPRPALQIEIVSDEELLAQFPGRPVALVGPSSNRQLIFLDAP